MMIVVDEIHVVHTDVYNLNVDQYRTKSFNILYLVCSCLMLLCM